ncbi:MAG: hypothetical protein DYG89_11090 [Caldilinea sp. CFX5]|nr:hypothetical protein [Caldilinea sp. CFX5]
MKQFQFLLILCTLLPLLAGCKFARQAASSSAEAAAGATPTATSLVSGLRPTFTATPPPPVATTPAAAVALLAATPTLESTPTVGPRLAPVLALHGGILTNVLYMDTVPAAQINELSAQFYPASNLVPARYDIDRYQINFQTVDESDQSVNVRAELFFPRLSQWATFPVLVYGSGTTGIGAACAPLDEWTRRRNWGNYRTHMLSYAAQGFIAVFPLWQGYDDAVRTHPYFVARLEGYLLLDAARAVYNFFAAPPAPDILAQPLDAVFFSGYSQGGHGAFAADQFAPWYAPELTVKGVIGHATAPSVEALLRERPPLAPYIVHAYSTYYGPYVIAPEKVFLPQWLPTFTQDVTSKCVDEVYQYYPQEPGRLYRTEFLDALYSGQLNGSFAAFKQVLDLNYVGASINPNTPALLLHGAVDPVVTAQTNEAFMAQICGLGKRVTYYLYPEVDHFATRQYAFGDTLRWMQKILNGGAPRSDCPVVTNTGGG